MDVSSLHTNIPQEEGTEIACKAYDSSPKYNPPIPTRFLRDMFGLILNENSFKFNGENYLQTRGTAMGTEMAVSSCYGTKPMRDKTTLGVCAGLSLTYSLTKMYFESPNL